MISRFLIGMGTSPIISIGVTYIDDCCTKEKFAKYVGKKYTFVNITRIDVPTGLI